MLTLVHVWNFTLVEKCPSKQHRLQCEEEHMSPIEEFGYRSACLLIMLTMFWSPEVKAAEPLCEDPAVIYCNDFEDNGFGDMHRGANTLIINGTAGSETFRGTAAARADFVLGANFAAAEMGIRFSGAEQVYARFYVRWDGAFTKLNHWIGMHGDGANDWGCHGGAGCLPNGSRCLSGTGVDMKDNDALVAGTPFFYTYHLDMNCDSGGYCSGKYGNDICAGCAERGSPCPQNKIMCCWGKWVGNPAEVQLKRGTWYAIELMVRANTVLNGVGNADGEIILWVEGVEVSRQAGLRWRHTEDLLVDHFIFWNYNPDANETYQITYDNLVVSTRPIGPIEQVSMDDAGPRTDGAAGGDTAQSNDGGDASDADGRTGGDTTARTGDKENTPNTVVTKSCACSGNASPLGWVFFLALVGSWRMTRSRIGAS